MNQEKDEIQSMKVDFNLNSTCEPIASFIDC